MGEVPLHLIMKEQFLHVCTLVLFMQPILHIN